MTTKQNFNECAHLGVPDVHKEVVATGGDTLANLMKLQKDIQENVYGYDFNAMREKISSLKQFYDMNYHAIQDELREVFQAITGIHSFPNAWKPWKSTHKEAMERKWDDLTEDEKKEFRMELVDLQHFLFNMMIAVDMTPEMLFNYYHSKNQENKDRQVRGY